MAFRCATNALKASSILSWPVLAISNQPREINDALEASNCGSLRIVFTTVSVALKQGLNWDSCSLSEARLFSVSSFKCSMKESKREQ